MNKKIQSQVLKDVVEWMKEFEWSKGNVSSLGVEKLLEKAISRAIELMEEKNKKLIFKGTLGDVRKIAEDNGMFEEQKAEFRKMIEDWWKGYAGLINNVGEIYKCIREEDYGILLAKLGDNHSPEDSTHKVQKNLVGSSGTSKGCGRMYCAVEDCNEVDISHTAYCIRHQRTPHVICGNNWLCPSCKKKTSTCICGHDKKGHNIFGHCVNCRCSGFQEVGG